MNACLMLTNFNTLITLNMFITLIFIDIYFQPNLNVKP